MFRARQRHEQQCIRKSPATRYPGKLLDTREQEGEGEARKVEVALQALHPRVFIIAEPDGMLQRNQFW